MFLAPKNFWGGSPKILAHRPTELGDYARGKKENKPQQNLSPLPQAIAYGRTKEITIITNI